MPTYSGRPASKEFTMRHCPLTIVTCLAAIISATGCSKPSSTPPASRTTSSPTTAPVPVSFLGIEDQAQSVVFIFDATGAAMMWFDDIRCAIRKTIDQLQPSQFFNVVFMQEDAVRPISAQLLAATPENKRRAYALMDSYDACGPVDPMLAVKAAFALKPQLIYFATDPGCWPYLEDIIAEIRQLETGSHARINAIHIGFSSQEIEETVLKQMAQISGGMFRSVRPEDLSH